MPLRAVPTSEIAGGHPSCRTEQTGDDQFVIRAFAQLNVAGATLEIAGQGDYRPALEALGRSLDLGERLKFLGFIDEDEKVDLLRRAWTTVLASPKEGWGISNLESAACGTPVIAGDSPGIRESVINGETGFLVPPSDVPAFAATRPAFKEPEWQLEYEI